MWERSRARVNFFFLLIVDYLRNVSMWKFMNSISTKEKMQNAHRLHSAHRAAGAHLYSGIDIEIDYIEIWAKERESVLQKTSVNPRIIGHKFEPQNNRIDVTSVVCAFCFCQTKSIGPNYLTHSIFAQLNVHFGLCVLETVETSVVTHERDRAHWLLAHCHYNGKTKHKENKWYTKHT